VDQLLFLGFLHCRHPSTSKAAEYLWGIVNPKIKETMTREELFPRLQKLFFAAIGWPKAVFEQMEHRDEAAI